MWKLGCGDAFFTTDEVCDEEELDELDVEAVSNNEGSGMQFGLLQFTVSGDIPAPGELLQVCQAQRQHHLIHA